MKTIKYKSGNGHSPKITQNISCLIRQLVYYNSAMTTHQLAIKIQEAYSISISHTNIWQYIKKKEYKSIIPFAIPILT
ncbi:6616_t:CDS:1, partial [Ambispora leptoticha]